MLHIEGGRPLHGTIEVPGSKNSALAILSAVVLTEGTTVLHNVPNVSDTRTKSSIIESFGASVEWREGSLFIDCSNIHAGDPSEESFRKIRTSFYMLGPLLARVGKLRIPASGGCKIGARPVDYHLKGLSLMGAKIELRDGMYIAEAKELRGTEIYLDFPSAGATQHLMTTAVLAKGMTVIKNAAMEPEVTALADFLCRMGAKIEGAGTGEIVIIGKESLDPCEFRVPSDRIQAGTYLLAGAITGGEVTVTGITPDSQSPVVSKLREAGAEVNEGPDAVTVSAKNRLRGIRIRTMPWPGFPTDIQQPVAAVLALADGVSTIEETIYESRIGHVAELNRMGANVRVESGRTSVIQGVPRLQGAQVQASDLRAGAALVLAGLAAEGETYVSNVHFIDRGYENLEHNLTGLGAKIERVEDNKAPAKESLAKG
ncbi:MAG: UDP-N-acetylglucosamine 1-carboxyvinyltransferase [Fimbriimonadaceae bacterium]|nr:UDP-N-acetylglucosamine 1-carboxyvinyltransferase [Fimbriimonadaceae bacterium]